MKASVSALLCVLLLAFGAESARADDRTPEQIKAAKEFTVEGIGFSATPQTIRTKWPTAERVAEESNAKLGLEVLRVDSTPNTDGVDFHFLDGRLMKMQVWYFPERVKKMGGYLTVAEKLVTRLGKADADSKGGNVDESEGEICQFDWVIPEAERWIRYHVTKKVAVLSVWDREVARKKEAKEKASADTGF